MSYFGVPPADGEKIDEPLLQPGWHEVKVERVERVNTKKGDRILVILGNDHGIVKEWLPAKIEGEKTAWKFWRLVGAAGYPSNEYWDGPKDRQWDIVRDLSDAARLGLTFMVRLAYSQFSNDPQVEEAVNFSRHPEKLPHALEATVQDSASADERKKVLDSIRSNLSGGGENAGFDSVPF